MGEGNVGATISLVSARFSNYKLYFCLFGSRVLYSQSNEMDFKPLNQSKLKLSARA
jgi:hypothetical protein